MTRANRIELEKALIEFVDAHPGLRVSRTFGSLSGYAGRRIFARVTAAGLECRLPRDLLRLEIARGARPAKPRGRTHQPASASAWLVYRPADARLDRTTARVLEEAARHAATASVTPAGPQSPRGSR